MLATGNSQLAFLAELVTCTDVDWARVTAFHMDEYVGLPPTHSASFQRYMRERVAAHAARSRSSTTSPGDTGDAAGRGRPLRRRCCAPTRSTCAAAGSARTATSRSTTRRSPTSTIPLDVKIVALEPASRRQQVGEGHFATIDDVPTHAITVTIPALLRAGRVLAIVPEARKAAPVRDALAGPDHDRVPGVVPAPPAARDAVPRRGVGVAARRVSAAGAASDDDARIRAGAALPEPARARAPAPAARRRPVRHRASRSRSRCAPQLGLAPWDVFHQGVAKAARHLVRRRSSCSSASSCCSAWIPLRQRLGLGTILNTLSVGFIANLGLDADPASSTCSRSRVADRAPRDRDRRLRRRRRPLHRLRARPGTARRADDRDHRARPPALGRAHGARVHACSSSGSLLGGEVGVGTVLIAFSLGPVDPRRRCAASTCRCTTTRRR